MPTYEYACSSCAHEWEAEQSIKEDALKDCPGCHQPTAKRQISRGTGFILKGSGWYADLYASGSNKPAAKSAETSEGSASSGEGAGGGGGKSEGSSSSSAPSTGTGTAASSSGSSTAAA